MRNGAIGLFHAGVKSPTALLASRRVINGAKRIGIVWREEKSHDHEGVREGIEDVEAGRTESVDEVFEELRVKHGLPG
jgi:hypothetical protein